jgi:hypothetical protein
MNHAGPTKTLRDSTITEYHCTKYHNNIVDINNVTATEYLEMGQSGQRNQKGEIDIELSD